MNFSKKFSFSFFIFLTVLLSLTSVTFADASGQQSSASKYSFLDNLSNLLNINDSRQQPLTLQTSQPKEDGISHSPVFDQFDNWVKSYINNGYKADNETLDSGEDLAVKRKQLLKELVKLDPKAALDKAISAEDFERLPSFITENSEKRISARGDFLVYVLDGLHAEEKKGSKMVGSRTEREVVIGDSRYKAVVYGRREAMTTKLDIPLQGIVIDDMMVVDENPVRKIHSKENADRGDAAISEEATSAEVGGKIVYFSNEAAIDNFVNEQIEWESVIGPVRKDTANGTLAPEETASAWTEGAKTILVIRAVFSDKQSEPVDPYNQPLTAARLQNLFANEVNPFYVNNSYNKTSMQATVTERLVVLPRTQAYYTQNYTAMFDDVPTAARQAGYEVNNYDLYAAGFSYTSGIGWAGLAFVGGKGALINGSFDIRVASHELGHNYGLNHANLWRTSDGSPIGQGSDVEYGDNYDMMGYGGGSHYHFNTTYKKTLNWLTAANVQTVTTGGDYQIFAQDASSSGGIRALKIKKDNVDTYWVEFRQLFTNNSNAMNGALLRWEYISGSIPKTQLLDMNPSTTSLADAPLVVGQSFYDSASQIRITVLSKGNTTPASLNIRVELNQTTNPTSTPTPVATPTPTSTCTYSITPASQSFGTAAGTGTINVNAPAGCAWTANSNQTFVTVTSGNSGSGNGTVTYSVAANTSGVARSAAILIGGQIFTVQQAGTTTGSYTLIASPSVIAPGGQLTISWTAPIGSSLYDWIGLYKVGTSNYEYLGYIPTNGTPSGSFSITLSQPGQYEFRYLTNNTFNSVSTSNTVTVQSVATPTPSATPTVAPTPSATPTIFPTTTPTPNTTPTPSGTRTNVALASNGGVASASSELASPRIAIDGVRNWATSGSWKDATPNSYPDWLQVDFAGTRSITEIDVVAVQDDYQNPVDPTESSTFSIYGVTNFEVQYWNGSNWATVPNGNIVGNNKVITKITFAAISTNRVRILISNAQASYSRIVELEAWSGGSVTSTPTPNSTPTVTPTATPTPNVTTTPTPNTTPTPGTRTNVALASNGGVASASSELASARIAIDGVRNWATSGAWKDATPDGYPDWLQVDFAGTRSITEIDVVAVQDDYQNPVDPTESSTFSIYGVTNFEVQYWNGAGWATLPNGVINNTNKVITKITFAAISTNRIRVVINNAQASYSRIVELEAWQ